MRFLKTALLLTILLFVSCCGCRKGKSADTTPFTETTWQLVQIEGRAIDAKADSYTLVFAKDLGVSGKGDCNRIMGSYSVTDNKKLDLSKLASTRMMCPDQATESKFLKVLSEVNAYALDGDMLMLLSDGEMKLAFKAVKEQ